MGNTVSTKNGSELAGMVDRASTRCGGKLAVSGRYHRYPEKITDKYKKQSKVLGNGYNGAVHLAVKKDTGDRYAVKAFRLSGASLEKRQDLEAEAEIFLSMDHPHVARLVDVYESNLQLELVMECMEGGELFERVAKLGFFSEKDAATAVFQMLLSINYIHHHGVVHRDVKLENFLYEQKDTDFLKLIDFGFSKIWEPNTRMALSCGSLSYIAPEVLGRSYTSQCDLWSLGVITYILLLGKMPFAGTEAEQMNRICAGRFRFPPMRVGSTAMNFVHKLLVVDPEARMTAEQALEHPWILNRTTRRNSEQLDNKMMESLVGFSHASKFRKGAFRMMAWSLTSAERSEVREAFLEIDKGHTGTISADAFREVLHEKFHLDSTELSAVFRGVAEHNSPDEIHYSEFLAAVMVSRIEMHDQLIKSTFDRFDKDHKGAISIENLEEVMGDIMSEEEIRQAVEDIGHQGEITYDEFVAYLRDSGSETGHVEKFDQVLDRAISEKPQLLDARADLALRCRNRVVALASIPSTQVSKLEQEVASACCTVS